MFTKLRLLTTALFLGLVLIAHGDAQVTVPNTLVAGTTITAAALNTNFSTIANHALDRLTGGNLAGNVTADAGVTIDGIDLSVALCSICPATFASVTVNGVGIIGATGKIPDLSATYFTAISASNFTTGTVPAARLGSGTPTASTFLRGDSTWATTTAAVTTAKSGVYTAVANDFVLATGTFTVTLPAASANLNAIIDVKNVSTGVVTIGRTGADTIDGATTQSLVTQYQSFTFISDGANWFIR